MAEIISVSIDKELADFLDENPSLSPSKIFQARLHEIMNEERKLAEKLKAVQIRLDKQSGRIYKINEWATANGIKIPDDVLE